jgi:hypothetical protein
MVGVKAERQFKISKVGIMVPMEPLAGMDNQGGYHFAVLNVAQDLADFATISATGKKRARLVLEP